MIYVDGIHLIGNFLLEAVERKVFQFEIKKLYIFSKVLTMNLQDTIYYTKFVPADVLDFLERFPEFLHASGSHVMIPNDDVRKIKRQLTKQFRSSLQQELVQIMHKSAVSVLETGTE